MNKISSLLLSFVLLGSTVFIGYSQDTTQAVKKAPVTVAKPYYKHRYYKPGDTSVHRQGYRAYKPVTDTTNKTAAAVVPPAPVIVDNTLLGQYNEVLKKMYPYERTVLAGFHKNYIDTLNAERRKVRDAQAKIAELNKTITELQSEATSKDQVLSDSQSKSSQMSFLGMSLSQTIFAYIMWALVLLLGGWLGTVIYLSGANKREASYRIQLHDELTAEFQTYKAKANEKEKKLARELQTERNKYDELKEQKDKEKKK